jgi:hypothetical protein
MVGWAKKKAIIMLVRIVKIVILGVFEVGAEGSVIKVEREIARKIGKVRVGRERKAHEKKAHDKKEKSGKKTEKNENLLVKNSLSHRAAKENGHREKRSVSHDHHEGTSGNLNPVVEKH